jgi:hypothetical protein
VSAFSCHRIQVSFEELSSCLSQSEDSRSNCRICYLLLASSRNGDRLLPSHLPSNRTAPYLNKLWEAVYKGDCLVIRFDTSSIRTAPHRSTAKYCLGMSLRRETVRRSRLRTAPAVERVWTGNGPASSLTIHRDGSQKASSSEMPGEGDKCYIGLVSCD